MRLGVFAYDFPHWKTQTGILNLVANGLKPQAILAQKKKKLNIEPSHYRVAPKDLFLMEPRELAKELKISYHVLDHDSVSCQETIKFFELDIGLVLGARILKRPTIDAFGLGVINMHPGILPDNRGLDNLKWAIYHGMDQGVTVHWIDEYVDRGHQIAKERIKIYDDDTLIDIHLRLQNLEQKLMIEVLQEFQEEMPENLNQFHKLDIGRKFGTMPWEIEKNLEIFFRSYKDNKGEPNGD